MTTELLELEERDKPVLTDAPIAVTAMIIDKDNTPWVGASYQITLVGYLGGSRSPIFTAFGNPVVTSINGHLDKTGKLAVQLAPNSAITPSGTKWHISIIPLAVNGSCAATFEVLNNQAGLDVTNLIKPFIIAPRFSMSSSGTSTAVNYGYADAEVTPPQIGDRHFFYLNTTENAFRFWNGTAFENIVTFDNITAVGDITAGGGITVGAGFKGKGVLIESTDSPQLKFINDSSPVDEKQWDFFIDNNTGLLHARCINDAANQANDWLQVSRAGIIANLILLNAAISVNGNASISGWVSAGQVYPHPVTSQSTFLNWDLQYQGEADFINVTQAGNPGGFAFYNATWQGTPVDSNSVPIMRVNSFGQLFNSGGFYGGTAAFHMTALNTAYSFSFGGGSGLLVMRDNTLGGSAVFQIDPNIGVNVLGVNQIAGLSLPVWNGGVGQWQIQITTGQVPRDIVWCLHAA